MSVTQLLFTRPKVSLLVACALAFFCAVGALSAEIDLSFRPLYLPDPAAEQATERAYREFGQVSDGMVGVLVTSSEEAGVVRPVGAQLLRDLSAGLAQLDGVGEPLGPTDLLLPVGGGSNVVGGLAPLVDPAGHRDDVQRQQLRDRRARFADLASMVLADDLERAVIWVPLDAPMTDPAARASALQGIERALELVDEHPAFDAELVGYAVVERAYEGIFLVGMVKTVALAGLLVALLLLVLLGSWRAVVVSMAGTGLAIPATLGLMGAAGHPVTLVSAAMPTLLMVIGVADALHLLVRYQTLRAEGQSRERAASQSVRGLWRPVLLTSLTTAAGFLSLAPASLPIVQQFGLSSAGGVLLLLVVNLLAAPALMVLLDPLPAGQGGWSHRAGVILEQVSGCLSELGLRHPRAVTALGLIVLGSLCALAPSLEVSQPFNRDVDEQHPVRRAQVELERSFPGFQGPELVVRRKDGAKLDAEDWRAIRDLEHRVQNTALVEVVVSIADAASTDEPAVELALMKLDTRTESLSSRLLSGAGDRALLLVRTGDIGTERASVMLDSIERHIGAARAQTPHLEIELVGSWVRAQRGMALLVHDLLRSLLLASVLVFFALLTLPALRRSPLRLLAALLANVMPVVSTLGVMALFGIPLKIGTSVAVVVAMGIAVDDTLHFASHLSADRCSVRATRHALATVARPMWTTTMALAIGFCCLPLVGLSVVAEMGLIGAFALVLALLCDLVWLPAMLSLGGPAPSSISSGENATDKAASYSSKGSPQLKESSNVAAL